MQYYGSDIALFVFMVMHLLTVRKKPERAFMWGMAAAISGAVFGFFADSKPMMLMNFIFFCLYLWNHIAILRNKGLTKTRNRVQ